MGVAKRKRSKSKQRSRQANRGVKVPALVECSNANCKALIRPHTVCPECGYYQGRQVIEIDTERKQRKELD